MKWARPARVGPGDWRRGVMGARGTLGDSALERGLVMVKAQGRRGTHGPLTLLALATPPWPPGHPGERSPRAGLVTGLARGGQRLSGLGTKAVVLQAGCRGEPGVSRMPWGAQMGDLRVKPGCVRSPGTQPDARGLLAPGAKVALGSPPWWRLPGKGVWDQNRGASEE